MNKEIFQLVDISAPKKQNIFSIRMEDEDIKKLHKYAKQNNMNFHRFVKSILNGYINYQEKGNKKGG